MWLEKLAKKVHDNTVVLAEKYVPAPEFPTENEYLAWQKVLCDRLESRASNGETTFDVVFATTTYYKKDVKHNYHRLPKFERNEALCIYTDDLNHVLSKLSIHSSDTNKKCSQCDTLAVSHKLNPDRDFIRTIILTDEEIDENGFYFCFLTCATPTCVTKCKEAGTKIIIDHLCKNGYRLETTNRNQRLSFFCDFLAKKIQKNRYVGRGPRRNNLCFASLSTKTEPMVGYLWT
jgi:hypothetical protein